MIIVVIDSMSTTHCGQIALLEKEGYEIAAFYIISQSVYIQSINHTHIKTKPSKTTHK